MGKKRNKKNIGKKRGSGKESHLKKVRSGQEVGVYTSKFREYSYVQCNLRS